MAVDIITTRLPDGVLGATDGVSRIWLDDRLLAAERRVVLAHEHHHLTEGHAGACRATIERRIDYAVACALITIEQLTDAARWSEHAAVIADELGVTPELIIDRTHTLTHRERRALEAGLAGAHWNVP